MQLALGVLALLSVVLAGCQGAPPPPSRVSESPSTLDAEALAAEALGRGDYAAAFDLYGKALAGSPHRLATHYGLAIAASHLDRRPDTIREFTWVMKNGTPGSEEVRVARQWLEAAGALSGTFAAAATSESDAGKATASTGTVHGRMTFGENPGDVSPQQRAQLFLYDHPNRVNYYRIRTDEQGRFVFRGVPPGIYKLTDRAAGQPRWRLRLEVKAGQDLAVDLSPANSTRARDDFPDAS